MALYSEYYEGHSSDEMIMVLGPTLLDNRASWYHDYSNQLKDGTLSSNFEYFK